MKWSDSTYFANKDNIKIREFIFFFFSIFQEYILDRSPDFQTCLMYFSYKGLI